MRLGFLEEAPSVSECGGNRVRVAILVTRAHQASPRELPTTVLQNALEGPLFVLSYSNGVVPAQVSPSAHTRSLDFHPTVQFETSTQILFSSVRMCHVPWVKRPIMPLPFDVQHVARILAQNINVKPVFEVPTHCCILSSVAMAALALLFIRE
jgi:hypothetical protein